MRAAIIFILTAAVLYLVITGKLLRLVQILRE